MVDSAPPATRLNLADAIREHAQERPDDIALIEAGWTRRTLTWAEFDSAVTEAAAAMAALGVVAGQRVMFRAGNDIDSVVAWFGAARGGIIAVPVNPGGTLVEQRQVADHAQARLFLGDSDLGAVRRIPLEDYRSHAGPDPRVASVTDSESIAAVIYTAGTSGMPKGVMLSHRALLASCAGTASYGMITANSTVLAVLPLFHSFGLNAVLGTTVYVGGTAVLAEYDRDVLPELIARERVTVLPLTPSALYRLTLDEGVVAAVGSVKLVTSGAAPMPAVVAERFRRLTGLPVHQGYGMTEAGPSVATTVGGEWLGSNHVGRALPGVEIRIDDGSGATDPGEIVIRGPNLFSGYWPDGAEGPDADGWFHTGDLGYLDGEELYVVDRCRELIIVSGFNVFPSEVEQVLAAAPGVESAAVVGVSDDETGERVVAFLTGDVKTSEVMEYAEARLARYKLPREVMVMQVMPRSTTGKIRKGLLRDLLDRAEDDDE